MRQYNFRDSFSVTVNFCSFFVSYIWDMLRAVKSVDRLVVGARFSTPVQTGLGAHSASTVSTGSFLGDKATGVWHLALTPI